MCSCGDGTGPDDSSTGRWPKSGAEEMGHVSDEAGPPTCRRRDRLRCRPAAGAEHHQRGHQQSPKPDAGCTSSNADHGRIMPPAAGLLMTRPSRPPGTSRAARRAILGARIAGVTQWSECDLPKVEVAGSTPVSRCRRTGAARGVPTAPLDIVPSRPLIVRAEGVTSRFDSLCREATDKQQAAALARTTPGRAC
jgi:hypothetical protein